MGLASERPRARLPISQDDTALSLHIDRPLRLGDLALALVLLLLSLGTLKGAVGFPLLALLITVLLSSLLVVIRVVVVVGSSLPVLGRAGCFLGSLTRLASFLLPLGLFLLQLEAAGYVGLCGGS